MGRLLAGVLVWLSLILRWWPLRMLRGLLRRLLRWLLWSLLGRLLWSLLRWLLLPPPIPWRLLTMLFLILWLVSPGPAGFPFGLSLPVSPVIRGLLPRFLIRTPLGIVLTVI